ncbi:MAG: non-lysosomal glucosylceramidase, partial [Chloroflexota bacterium]|nr:non-lysosomal glucosylceramidase [Chloroflexota bacterium]
WHLEVGRHRFAPSELCQFSLYVERADGSRESHVLSTLRPDETQGWSFDYPLAAGEYAALFPRAWLTYDWEALPVRLTQTQLSPVLPHNYRESSFPVGVFDWAIENRTDEPLRVGLMFSWLAMDVTGAPAADATFAAGPEGISLTNASGGQFGLAAQGGSITSRAFDPAQRSGLWADFSADGALDANHAQPTATRQLLGGAVAATLELAPHSTAAARFALAWDFPTMTFGSGRTWYRRYTRFWGRQGSAALEIACEGLRRFGEWNAEIEAWQRPILNDSTRPEWYSMALFNELYILVDGGSAWEDGALGEPAPVDGEGRFCFLECFDYAYYNTHDVLFYASWALLLLWPELERRSVTSLIDSLPVEDDREVRIIATGERAVRKEAWAAPHDLGAPSEDPWIAFNAYDYQDPNRWKDLNAKFVLQTWRDARTLSDRDLLRRAWTAVEHALDRLLASDADGDGLPDHDGRADQTFDNWTMEGPSAYAGGLWLAALSAAEAMARELDEPAAAERYRDLWRRGSASYRDRLWTGTYLRYDGSASAHSDSVMAGQLTGAWWADATGLPAFLGSEEVELALRTIVRHNVRGFAGGDMGAVNGMRPDGSVDGTSEQSQEVWPGVVYSLCALLLHRGLDAEAWETAGGAVRTTYERGYWFRTPEAWDAAGNFRASLYMRPLSIWAMEHALRSRG